MSQSPTTQAAPKPAAALLGVLVAGGFLASLWALFQWAELLVARAGGTPFCAISETFNCSSVWDSPFAKVIHTTTMVPVAGWGLMWGLVAFALPLIALVAPARLAAGLGTAIRIVGGAGLASVVVLAIASLSAGHVCIGCLGTYFLVILWAIASFQATKATGFSEPQKGLFWAGGATILAYLALLAPGMMTPHATDDVANNAIAKANAAKNDANAANPSASPANNAPSTPGPWDGPANADPAIDTAVETMLGQLPPDALQIFSNLLGEYDSEKPAADVPAPRVVVGSKTAPVVVVDWTDPMCPHCAELHSILDQIRIAAGNNSLAVEPHFFPLDNACNPTVPRKDETMGAIRCTATKALLCLEDDNDKFALAQKLIFENQAALTGPEKVWDVLRPIADRAKLEKCMTSEETTKKLMADIDSANKNHLEGTPLVLLNGKEVKPFGPLLYALALTGGKTHAAPFKSLPAPKPMPQQPH